MIKTCVKCNSTKDILEFYAATRGLFGVRGECKECTKKQKQEYKHKNRDVVNAKAKTYYNKNRANHLAQKQKYRQANKYKINALNKAYKVAKMNRVPAWIDKDEQWLIKEAYDLAAVRTKLFGFAWHVDHIIPLQGKNVSGLHVMANLQVIPAVENIKKKNAFEVA